ncbi:hypothetical protein [Microbacterium tenebrionis]|nr:hypothetical protein [Microbacterium ihumii]
MASVIVSRTPGNATAIACITPTGIATSAGAMMQAEMSRSSTVPT